jgi:probable HAF family extracellular repeat protein
VKLSDVPAGNVFSQAYDVSEDGTVVVGVSGNQGAAEAFRWTEANGMEGIGDLPGGTFASVAHEASRDGSVIVGYSHSIGSEPFRWSKETGMVGLGDLPGGGFGGEAYDVSADGSVVIGRSAGTNPFNWSAFRWTAKTGMIGIPPIPGGGWAVTAEAVSADGNVVVGGTTSGIGPFAWDPYHGTRAVADLLREQGVDITGWELGIARGISADGLTIVGQGVPPGTRQQQAWALRLDPGTFVPEPSSVALSVAGVAVTILYACRRRARSIWRARAAMPSERVAGSVLDLSSGSETPPRCGD